MPYPRPPRLTDADIAQVESYLARGTGPIRDFEMLDGFFAALVTGPEVLSPTRVLPFLFGVTGPGRPLPLDDLDDAQVFLSQLVSHWNRQVTTFMAGEPWALWLRTPEGPIAGRWWARGFTIGMDQEDGWDPLIERRDLGPLFIAVTALAHEDSEDPELRPPPISPDDREVLLTALAYGLPELYAATRPDALAPEQRRPRPRKTAKAKKPAKPRKPKAAKRTRPRRRR